MFLAYWGEYGNSPADLKSSAITSAAPYSVLFLLTLFSANSQCLLHVCPFCSSPHCSSFSLPALALEQSPDTVIRQGESVSLSCSKKKSGSTYMCWYKLPLEKDSGLVLVVSVYQGAKATVEEDFRCRVKGSEIQGDGMTLSIEHAFLNDSGTYYCAESEAQWQGCRGS